MKDILVIGQKPPPIHGQSLSTERLLMGHYNKIKLHFVEANYSNEVKSVGKFNLWKIIRLLFVVSNSIKLRVRRGVKNLYYMPACSGRIPFYRDIIILLVLRPFFKTTLFHFRSAGIEEVYSSLFWFEKVLFDLAYSKPDLAIQLSEFNPNDGTFLGAKKTCIVPNGIIDDYLKYQDQLYLEHSHFSILYIGTIQDSKGILDLLKAGKILKDNDENFIIHLVGGFRDKKFEIQLLEYIDSNGLKDMVKIYGELTGDEKWGVFKISDVLVFPTYYENESFGNVIIEAMQFKLPVIATDWRAAKSIVEDGKTGFIIPIKNPVMIAKRVQDLIQDQNLKIKMGKKGRTKFLENYEIKAFWNNMEKVLHKNAI